MTLVKRVHNPFFSMFDNMFNEDFDKNFKPTSRAISPAVNVRETETAFELEVVAPGFSKENFSVKTEEDLLKISAETKQDNEEKEGEKLIRREYAHRSFTRKFTLPENVDSDAIKATYTDGMLNISLPKQEVEVAQTKEISID